MLGNQLTTTLKSIGDDNLRGLGDNQPTQSETSKGVLISNMAVKNSCSYCNFIHGSSKSIYDYVIDETDNFVVVPTLGSLLPGWQLICPKQHQLNATLVSQESKLELVTLVEERVRLTADLYNKRVVVFEHGAIVDGSVVGCGVDHAHIHVLPVDFDFIKTIKLTEKSFQDLDNSENILDFYLNHRISDSPYWICSDGDETLFTSEMQPTSQFFRKVIAKELNKEACFDYKEHPHIENVIKTVSDFSDLKTKLAM